MGLFGGGSKKKKKSYQDNGGSLAADVGGKAMVSSSFCGEVRDCASEQMVITGNPMGAAPIESGESYQSYQPTPLSCNPMGASVVNTDAYILTQHRLPGPVIGVPPLPPPDQGPLFISATIFP